MLNVAQNRKNKKWTRREQAQRVLWALTVPLFKFSPRPFWRWRCFLLRCYGAQIGSEVHIYPSVQIAIPWNLVIGDQAAIGDCAKLYALGKITIGARSTISQGAHVCAGTHDIADPARPLLKPPITIGNDVWICADAFIGPGIVVADGAIVAARAVAVKNVALREVVAGNPARRVRFLEP